MVRNQPNFRTGCLAAVLLAALASAATAATDVSYSDRGWYTSAGTHNAGNTNYFVGWDASGGSELRNYFAFDLSRLGANVLSADFVVNSATSTIVGGSETYVLSEVTTPVATLVAGGSGLTAIFNDLGDGAAFGTRVYTSADDNQDRTITLSPAAVAAINAARGGSFALGGSISTLSGTHVSEFLMGFSFNSGASSKLVLTTTCGNGVVDSGEVCDDGDTDDGDGCDRFCTVEQCWSCDGGSPTTCTGLTGPSCDDGLYCNGADTCNAGACSGHAGDPCSDGPQCANSCNEYTDSCSSNLDYNQCDDGQFCNGFDYCLNGLCDQHSGDPCTGPDGDANCHESCDETSASCTANDPDGSPCPADGLPCTQDVCVAGVCHSPVVCDDDDSCTQDSCNEMDGSCIYDDAPVMTCRQAGLTSLSIKQNADDAKDALSWKWSKGEATTVADLSDPTSTADYRLCIYDDNGLVTSATLDAGSLCAADKPCWSSNAKGFKYSDKGLSHDGIKSAVLASGEADAAKVSIKGKGVNLPDPMLPVTGTVTVQLHNDHTNVCIGSTFSGEEIGKNEAEQLKAKHKAP